jgi:hypothetical protein
MPRRPHSILFEDGTIWREGQGWVGQDADAKAGHLIDQNATQGNTGTSMLLLSQVKEDADYLG